MKSNRPKILHITRGTGKAGIERIIIAITKALSDRFDFGHLGLFGSGLVDEKFQEMGIETLCAEITEKKLIYYPLYFRSVNRLSKIISNFGADIVHLYHPPHQYWVGKAAHRAGAKLVLEACNANIYRREKLAAFVERKGMHLVDTGIAISKFVLAEYRDRFGVDPSKFTVIYNGTDTNLFKPPEKTERESIRRELHIPENALVIGGAGRLIARKGFEFLVEAFMNFCKIRSGAVLLIIGDGNEFENLKRLCKDMPSEKTVFTGYRKDVPELLRAIDIYVCPSIHEVFGLTLTEGMATGLACIASRTGGFIEIGTENEDCLFVPPGEIEPLEDAIEKLATDISLREKLGKAAREKIVREFSIEKMIARRAELYEELLAV